MIENINATKVKELSLPERERLCEEIRSKIIDTVKKCGGHLSSNLGVVELTLGLFTVFDFPNDKVIWDVGHQCYPYKLLTDRYDRFDTLRKKGGLSGFPKRGESVYDCYDTGHAGNSVSAAIGMAKAFDLKGEKRTVIAVLGDGSFNNGLIYEALNSLSSLGVKILIVLNDNGMSISPTVGKTHELFTEKKKEEQKKNIALLEQYGVKYIGGVNGNNLKEVTAALQNAKELLQGSTVLMHIHTVKGRGYDFCEENPTQTHGVPPYGSAPTSEYSHIFGKKMIELAEKDPSVAVVSAAMTDALGLRPFFDRFPERAFDVGICEENASVLCSGMACGGMKPYYAIYSTFLQRAFDEIIHDICAQDLPVTFCIDRGGLSGADGETHQGVFDLSYLSLIPDITIAVPKDGEEFAEMLEFSLGYNHPLAIRYPRAAKASFGKKRPLSVGTFEYLEGDGSEKVTVLACGERAIAMAYAVREKTKLPFAIVNARFVKPLDKQLLSSVRSPYVLTIEDNVRIGGFGSLIEDFYADSDKKIKVFAYDDKFIPHGGVEELQTEYGLDTEDIAAYIARIYAN
jgi:1-deoxy-D-xylulose-5-phosphate synthase